MLINNVREIAQKLDSKTLLLYTLVFTYVFHSKNKKLLKTNISEIKVNLKKSFSPLTQSEFICG